MKSLKEKFGVKDELSLALDDLCITDDNVEPAKSEEWLCAIDRGELVTMLTNSSSPLKFQFDVTFILVTHTR